MKAFRCDGCDDFAAAPDRAAHSLPKGWRAFSIPDAMAAGAFHPRELCPGCAARFARDCDPLSWARVRREPGPRGLAPEGTAP